MKIGRRAKALIIGALPLPCQGPWVHVGDCKAWKVSLSGAAPEGALVIDILEEPVRRIVLDGEPTIIHGMAARASILKRFTGNPISIILEEVRSDDLG